MGNFAENLNLGNRVQPPPWISAVPQSVPLFLNKFLVFDLFYLKKKKVKIHVFLKKRRGKKLISEFLAIYNMSLESESGTCRSDIVGVDLARFATKLFILWYHCCFNMFKGNPNYFMCSVSVKKDSVSPKTSKHKGNVCYNTTSGIYLL